MYYDCFQIVHVILGGMQFESLRKIAPFLRRKDKAEGILVALQFDDVYLAAIVSSAVCALLYQSGRFIVNFYLPGTHC